MTALFILTGVLYTLSCGLYLAFLVKGQASIGRIANGVLSASALAHSAFLTADFALRGHMPFGDIQQTLSVAALMIVVAYLLALAKYHIGVLGAFITPVTLLLFMGAALGRSVAAVPAEVRSALLPFHIAVNVLGIAAFALAFATSIAYVIQDHLLREKRLGGIFQRLPALDELDSLGFKLVTIGFPLLTIGIITGTIWAVKLDRETAAVSTSQGFALLAWLVFAGVLLLRVAAGWQGRRAAIGTMLGFAFSMAVLVGYMLRDGGL